jgi:hypothetical protein
MKTKKTSFRFGITLLTAFLMNGGLSRPVSANESSIDPSDLKLALTYATMASEELQRLQTTAILRRDPERSSCFHLGLLSSLYSPTLGKIRVTMTEQTPNSTEFTQVEKEIPALRYANENIDQMNFCRPYSKEERQKTIQALNLEIKRLKQRISVENN